MNDPLFFLNHQSYGTYSRDLARKLGIAAAVLLAELVEKRHYHLNELIDDPKHGSGWFYQTIDNLEDRTGLSRKQQETALNLLKEKGLVEVKSFGLPCRRHFKINNEKVLELYGLAEVQPSLSKSYKLVSPEVTNQNVRELQTAPYIEEPKEKPKEKYAPFSNVAQTSASSSKSEEKKTEHADGVFLSNSEHKKLVEKFGSEEIVKEGCQELSEWKKSALPSQVKKHSSDYLRLRKWAIPDLIERNAKAKKLGNGVEKPGNGSELVEKRREGAQRFIKQNWERSKEKYIVDKVDHLQIGNDTISYQDPKFDELLKHYFKKIGW